LTSLALLYFALTSGCASDSGLKLGENPVTTFPIKKRSNTDLFIDKMAALYIVDGRIKNEHVVRVVNHWYWIKNTLC